MTRILFAAAVAIPLSAIALYVINPFGVPSKDPRERIVGWGIYRAPSASMTPAVRPGQIVFVRAGSAVVASLKRFDVIVFEPPHHPGQAWLKRVVALSGETVEIRGGALHIDGRRVEEPHVDPASVTQDYSLEMPPRRVPSGAVFVLGDNRDNSEDSRFWGMASLSKVRGRVP